MGQTTVTLPTIPCSTCNGPGSFTISSPTCGGGQVTSPLTLSWAAATGATSYTIMIATDANFTQNLATTTVTGTSLSIPSNALKASTFYYWTVIANSASGSTKASNSCQFVTDGTFTAISSTGAFPAGSGTEVKNNALIANGTYSCQASDGTCASGDNLICNPKFLTYTTGTNTFTPDWYTLSGTNYSMTGLVMMYKGVLLSSVGVPPPPSGTKYSGLIGATTPIKFIWNGIPSSSNVPTQMVVAQPIVITNSGTVSVNYQVSFYGRGSGAGVQLWAAFGQVLAPTPSDDPKNNNPFGQAVSVSDPLSLTADTWSLFTINLSIPAGFTSSTFYITGRNVYTTPAYVTDLRVCKL
ncbi:hypothetical protein [Emticicia sp. 17c]|uniref:hypothetical protein n=1 Tax=Emticicia sp. 17c TaxID=3127704 RepID=UPI00301E5AF1